MIEKKFQDILRILMLLCMDYDRNKLLSELFSLWEEMGFSTKMEVK